LLTPEADCRALLDALQNSHVNSILLASHMPLVGNLLDVFCGTKSGFHSMNTSSLACVDCEIAAPGLGTLRWLRHVNE
jgi:phosphohistidine phosphatase